MENEITVNELKKLPSDSYVLIDMRNEYAFSYGHIDGAAIPQKKLEENYSGLPKDKKLIIYCKSGIRTKMAHTAFWTDMMNSSILLFISIKQRHYWWITNFCT